MDEICFLFKFIEKRKKKLIGLVDAQVLCHNFNTTGSFITFMVFIRGFEGLEQKKTVAGTMKVYD